MYASVKKILRVLSLFVLITSCVDDNETPFQADKAGMNSKVYPQNPPDDKIDNAIDFINTVFKKDEKKTNGAAAHQYTQADITNTFEIADAQKKVRLKLLCFQPSGYALISALEDAKLLVLWYSEGIFNVEHIHPGLSNYIGEFMEYVKDHPVKGNRTNVYAPQRPSGYCKPETYVLKRYSVIQQQKGPLLTTYWGQRHPFNSQCQKINDSCCLAGCVPIAIGQIINYHRKDNHKSYNWEQMKNIYNPETSAFIHDIGVAAHTKYGLHESGTYDEDALIYFKDAGYTYYRLMDYDYTTLKKNIDWGSGYPVYVSAFQVYERRKKGRYFIIRWGWKYYDYYDYGHAWVVDGYREVTNYEEVEKIYIYIDGPEPKKGYPYGSRNAPPPPGYDDELSLYDPDHQCPDPSRYTRSITTHFIHINWGWRDDLKYEDEDCWCTYNYFKPKDEEEFKYKKKMIAF